MLLNSLYRVSNRASSLAAICKHGRKSLSTTRASAANQDHKDGHRVLVSTSTNIHENLALEDWLYENTDLEKQSVLLLWQNGSAVVFGRHQNPWVECNVREASRQEVDLARRKSGGGTVYHDEGNLNCSFIKRRTLYGRKANLEFVIKVLKAKWDVDICLNDRNDVLLDGIYKISGTASKLGGKKTYHHFTLLFNVDKKKLHSLLDSTMEGVKSKATPSTRMSVANMVDRVPNMNFHSLVDMIGTQFLMAGDPKTSKLEVVDPMNKEIFPRLEDHLSEISSWEWTYGKTPPFSIHRKFTSTHLDIENSIQIDIDIVKGLVNKIDIEILLPGELEKYAISLLRTNLLETRLCRNEVMKVLSQLKMDWIFHNYYTLKTRQTLDWILLCVIETLGI